MVILVRERERKGCQLVTLRSYILDALVIGHETMVRFFVTPVIVGFIWVLEIR